MNENLKKLKDFKEKKYGESINNISEECYQISLNLLKLITKDVELFLTYNKTVQFEFENLLGQYLEVEVSENGYNIWGENTEINYKDDGIFFKKDKLYEVINHIKIFFNGFPKNSVLFTGAFNPPTIAHYHMIDSALNNNNFDYVIFALSNQRFLDKKQNKINDYSYSEKQRLNMILSMTYKNDNVLIFGIEQGYTYEVLCAVKEKYNLESLYFAMGSDKLNEIQKWGFHNKLLKEFCFYTLIRGSDNKEDVVSKCSTIFKNTKFVIGYDNHKFKNISATKVRNCIKNKKNFSNLVHHKVEEYLKNIHNLEYKND